MDQWEKTATLIAHDLFEWSNNCLETQSLEHGGMPVCPFAGHEWESGQAMIHLTDDLEIVTQIKATFPPSANQTHIIALTNIEGLSPEQLAQWTEEQNKKHFGVWLKSYHPERTDTPFIPVHERPSDWPEVEDYAVIVMQSFERIVAASEELVETPYYNYLSKEKIESVRQRATMLETWQSLTDGPAYEPHDEHGIMLAQKGVFQ